MESQLFPTGWFNEEAKDGQRLDTANNQKQNSENLKSIHNDSSG